jgi:[citrate (pro-3S)-lyase] ligase
MYYKSQIGVVKLFENYNIEIIQKENKNKRIEAESFLNMISLDFDQAVDTTILLRKKEEIVGTISAEDNLIKCMGVNPDYRNEGILNKLISEMIKYKYSQNIFELSVITGRCNKDKLESLGFYEVHSTDSVVLMENSRYKFKNYLESLEKHKVKSEKNAGIVMNLNPITNGHLYLLEKASRENEYTYVFLVSEDKSIIPYEDRLKLAKESTKNIKNLEILKGGDYIISSTTFPSYFTKDYNEWIDSYCRLDLNIFGKYISKSLSIKKRYVGSEPYCNLTSYYNKKMHEILPKYDIEVVEVDRLKVEMEEVSASKVRKLSEEDKFEELKKLVPEPTYKYLLSKRRSL